MSTVIIPELSKKNKWWISKHQYYELKHFCLQYPEWKRYYLHLQVEAMPSTAIERPLGTQIVSPTENLAMRRLYYANKINLVDKTCFMADKDIYEYLHKAVTEGVGFTYLKSFLDIPCGKDLFYDRYHKFFYLLSKSR
jgi:hypothetical protein